MYSVIDEIIKLRNDDSLTIDYENSNRYRIVLKEQDGSKTAYYFSTPIYNDKTKRLIDLKFCQDNNEIHSTGSNANISFTDKIKLTNQSGTCIINMDNAISWNNEIELKCGNDYIYPTTNGFVYKKWCDNGQAAPLGLEVDKPFMTIRSNNKYFSVMSESFTPFVTVSCIGSIDDNGNIISPATIEYQKLTDSKFCFTVAVCNPNAEWVMFEVNLYEPKTFQDTTVESANPTVNNSFGSIGFIGYTDIFGEQCLYTKPDFYKFSDIIDNRISKAIMHIPQLNNSNITLIAFKLASRFCSFGSAWDNKVDATNTVAYSTLNNGYQSIDITEMIIDKFGRLLQADGCIIRRKNKDKAFCAITTGDSYYRPQIYEINFR